jgi:hypothetical protein
MMLDRRANMRARVSNYQLRAITRQSAVTHLPERASLLGNEPALKMRRQNLAGWCLGPRSRAVQLSELSVPTLPGENDGRRALGVVTHRLVSGERNVFADGSPAIRPSIVRQGVHRVAVPEENGRRRLRHVQYSSPRGIEVITPSHHSNLLYQLSF